MSYFEKVYLFSEHFIVAFGFYNVFSDAFYELNVIDLDEPIDNIFDYFLGRYRIQFVLQIFFNAICLQLNQLPHNFLFFLLSHF